MHRRGMERLSWDGRVAPGGRVLPPTATIMAKKMLIMEINELIRFIMIDKLRSLSHGRHNKNI